MDYGVTDLEGLDLHGVICCSGNEKMGKRYLTSVHKVVFGDMSNLSIQVASNW